MVKTKYQQITLTDYYFRKNVIKFVFYFSRIIKNSKVNEGIQSVRN